MEIGPKTKALLNEYLHFSFAGSPAVSLPYSNNKIGKRLAGLRAFTGKGTPDDIRTELQIFSLSSKINPSKMTADEFKKFLVEKNLGIDCSGLVFHLASAMCKDNGLGRLPGLIVFSAKENFLRRLARRIRPAQNADVIVFSSPENSRQIEADEVEAGDIISMISEEKARNHVIFITGVEKNGEEIKINYIHSIAWDSDGRWNHGVRTGLIEMKKGQHIKDAIWTENGKQGEENKTYARALISKTEIRHLRFFE